MVWALTCPLPLVAQDSAEAAIMDIEADAAGLLSSTRHGPWLIVDAQYLYGWTRGAYLPPLVTTSPEGAGIENAGILGEPGTAVLFGDDQTARGPRSGVRLRGSVALDDAQQWWLAAEGFALPDYADHFAAASAGDPILARPFYDEALGLPNSELVSFPGLVAGHISVEASNEVWGTGITVHRNVLCTPCACCAGDGAEFGYRFDVLAGYRFLELSDRVHIDERLSVTYPAGPLLLDTQLDVIDEYASHSRFHGFDMGLRSEWTRGRYFVGGELRVALGQSAHRLKVQGATRISVPGVGGVSFPGGLLVGSDMCGEYTDREFAVVPQAELRVGRQFTDHLRCSIGYSFLYWSQVVRAGEHIGTTIDSSQLPSAGSTPDSTAVIPLTSSSFWVQGVTANLEWRY